VCVVEKTSNILPLRRFSDSFMCSFVRSLFCVINCFFYSDLMGGHDVFVRASVRKEQNE